MNVSEVMSEDVYVSSPKQTLRAAARTMADLDTGVLPIGEDNRLIGVVTDRDIVIRAVAESRDPETTTVSEVMSPGVCYCFEDEDVEDVADQMAELQVRRLPVLNRDKRLVGIVSLGDLAQETDTSVSGDALQGVSEQQ
jgi:CBS domain-containing protein